MQCETFDLDASVLCASVNTLIDLSGNEKNIVVEDFTVEVVDGVAEFDIKWQNSLDPATHLTPPHTTSSQGSTVGGKWPGDNPGGDADGGPLVCEIYYGTGSIRGVIWYYKILIDPTTGARTNTRHNPDDDA